MHHTLQKTFWSYFFPDTLYF